MLVTNTAMNKQLNTTIETGSADNKWSVIIQIGDDNYISHNQDKPNESIEGICAYNAWVSPNTPAEVIQVLKIRVAPRMGLVAILPNT